jgi:hypothetical protein
MSDRYEWIDADDADVTVAEPGEQLGQDQVDNMALVLGNPGQTALVVEGTADELLEFGSRVLNELHRALGGGHGHTCEYDEDAGREPQADGSPCLHDDGGGDQEDL